MQKRLVLATGIQFKGPGSQIALAATVYDQTDALYVASLSRAALHHYNTGEVTK